MSSSLPKRLSGLVFFLTVLLLPFLFLSYRGWQHPAGFQGVFSPGPLCLGHSQLACADCHLEPWRNARKAVGQEAARGAMDRACARCHGGQEDEPFRLPELRLLAERMIRPPTVGPHHCGQVSDKAHCAQCHEEHKGERLGQRVPDNRCVRCHQDLPARDGKATFARQVTGFDLEQHPPFGHWRGTGIVDRPGLHFSHQAHLHLADTQASSAIAQPLLRLRQQGCAFCHTPEADGRHFQPVRYSQHCAECHPLTVALAEPFASGKAQAAAAQFRQRRVPHGGSPEEVSRWLSGRLLETLRQTPEVLGPPEQTADERPFPGRPDSVPDRPQPLPWIEGQLGGLERSLFRAPSGCRFCHVEKAGTQERWPVYEPTRLCGRQLPHARFHHGKHEWLRCTDCHEGTSTSTRAQDVLTPSIQKCVTCHTTSSNVLRRARADCVECHTYHGATPAWKAQERRLLLEAIAGERHKKAAGCGSCAP